MSHSSVDESLVKNPVSTFYLPTLGGFVEKEDEQEDDQHDESEDDDEEELEDSREDGLFGQEEEVDEVEEAREGKTRALPKGPFGRTNVSPPAHALPFQELVSSVRCGKSEELAALQRRSER